MKNLINILMCLLMVVSLSGCNKTEQTENIDDTDNTDEVETSLSDKQEDELIALPEGRRTACVISSLQRSRKTPNGEVNNITNYDGTITKEFVEPSCYPILDEETDDKYTWYKIGEDKWIGVLPEWVIIRNENAADNKYSAGERLAYEDENAGYFPSLDSYTKSFFNDELSYTLTDEEYELTMFLKKTVPGLHQGSIAVYDFDSENPSDESKKELFWQIAEYSLNMTSLVDENIPGVGVTKQKFIETSVAVAGYTDKTSNPGKTCNLDGDCLSDEELKELVYWDLRYCVIPKENVDKYTQKNYGFPIDMTATQIYDAETQLYLYEGPTGYGMQETFPFILSIDKVDDSTINVEVACADVFWFYKDGVEYPAISDDNFNEIEDVDYFLNNEALKCLCTIKLDPEGNMTLRSVKVEN